MPKTTWTPEALSRAGTMSRDQAGVLAEVFRLLGDPNRLRIALLCAAGPRPVGEIAERLDMNLSLVSHHLRLLRAARLVQSERQGRQVIYSAADDHIRCVLIDMADHIAEWSGEDAE